MRLTAIVIFVALGACGVPSSDDLSTAGPEEVPYGLLSPEVPTSTTTTEARRSTTTAAVWFVAGERVLPLFRNVPVPADLDGLLASLVAGPTASEARLGARSAIPGEEQDIEGRIDAGTAVIELPSGFADVAPREQLLGLAQLVFTATELDAVNAVRFEIDGAVIAVPRADGSVTDGPLRRADYATLRP